MNLEITQYIDAALALHGFELNDVRRAEVEKQFHLLRSMNSTVENEPMSREIESANIFHL